jgi:hypothetical protein
MPMIKAFVAKTLMMVNFAEGIIHLGVSAISLWGIYDLGIWDARVLTAPITDLFLGVASLITSYFLKDVSGCMFHHHKNDKS